MNRKLAAIVVFVVFIVAVAALAAPSLIESRFNRTLKPPPYPVSNEAAKLHTSLTIADLHADSLLWSRDLRHRASTGHVDLPRLREANVALQAFTVVTQAPRNLNISRNSAGSDMVRMLAVADRWPVRTWNSRLERALYQAGRLKSAESDASSKLTVVRTAAELKTCIDAHLADHERICALLGIEGGQALDGNLENINKLYDAGFRMMSPTHFADTEIGGSASGIAKGGLTSMGRQWVRLMEDKKMVIDLAHSSPATLREVTAMATRPVLVSHTGARGTCANNRNLSDDELRAVARTGGVVGIGYWQTAVCGRDADAIARAIRYAVGIVGAEHVALGSDFDGAATMPFDASGIPQITDALLRAGFSDREIRQIMGENTVRVLENTLPD